MTKNTVCRLCSSCCPVEVEVENNRLVSATRKSFLPGNKQLVCPKLASAPEIVHSKKRLLTPFIRKDGALVESSWDNALNFTAKALLDTREKYGASSVAWLRGMAADWGAPWDYAARLMHAFGSPNAIGNGSVCHVAREMAHNFTYGAMTLPLAKDSRCILVWGKNDFNTCPPAAEAILHARQNGAHLIVVDPIKTRLARMADIWLPIKPGQDGLLAMSMINLILENNWFDRDFTQNFTIGLDRLARAAKAFDIESTAQSMGLDAEKVRQATRLYATTKPACIVEGNGLDMQLATFQATRAVCILRAITGNLDKAGGDFIPQPVPANNIRLAENIYEKEKPITAAYPLFSFFHPNWGLHAQSCLIDAILDEKPYPIKALVVQAGNPLVTMADSNRMEKALAKLDFLAVIDPFLTRTAQMAAVVLPACLCFEKTQLNRASMRNNLVLLQDEVISPVGQSRPDWQIVFDLAKKLGLAEFFPWKSVEEAIGVQLAPSGITVEALRKNQQGIAAQKVRFEKHCQDGFATPSGKVELFSQRLADGGQPGIPFENGFGSQSVSFEDELGREGLLGMSGDRTNYFTHSQFHNVDALAKRCPKAQANLHKEDAAERGIKDGDLLKISTPRGELTMIAQISDAVQKGCIQLGWGFGDADPKAGVNLLTDDDLRDPVTCTPSARSFYCKVERVEER